MASPQDLYGSLGSVPKSGRLEGSGAETPSVRLRANPEDFGSNIGEALQGAGRVGQQVTESMFQEQRMLNETLASNVEVKYAGELAALGAQYESKSGISAYQSLPDYTEKVAALKQKYSQSLPEQARPSFDVLAKRHELSAITDANKYAVTQLRKADYESAANSIVMAQTNAGFAPVAKDDYRFGETLGDIHANVARQFSDSPGIVQDKDTGQFSFENNEIGEKTKSDYEKTLTEATGKAWLNRFQTLADGDPISAFEKYKQDKQEIPSQYQVALESFFYPRVRDAYASGAANTTIKQADNGYSEAYAKSGKPDSVSVIMKNELDSNGQIRVHSDGDGQAIGGINSNAFPQQFAEASSILNRNGQEAARKYIENFYQKEIIEKNGIDKLPENVQQIVADGVVNHRSEIQKQLIEAAKNGASPQELIDIRRKEYERLVATGEKKYVDAASSWQKRLEGFEQQDFDGLRPVRPPTQADYYRANYSQILKNAEDQAEKTRPGDIGFANYVRSKVERNINDVIKQQELNYKLDNNLLYQAATGAMTNGKRPTTMEEIAAISPEMKRIVGDTMINQPQVYNSVESRLLTANSRGGDKDLREYGKGFFDLFHRIHAPDGNPDKINNITDLYSHVGPDGDLTMAGLDKLVQQMKASNTPSGMAEKQLQTTLLQKAKDTLVAFKGDQAGMDKFSAFQVWFFDAFDKAKSEGKNPAELLNPDSSSYMGKAIAAFNRSSEERIKDRLKDPMEYVPAIRTLDDVIADVKSGKLGQKEGKIEYEKLASEIREKKKNANSK